MNDKQIEERNDLFDSAVREQLTGYEPQVPHALWNRISSELDNGEVSDETVPMAEHHEARGFGRWRLAIAAAVLLTLTIGTLLYTLNPQSATNTVSATANNTIKPTKATDQPAAQTPPQVTVAKIVAQSVPVAKHTIIKKSIAPYSKPEEKPTVTATNNIPDATTTNASQDQTAENLEFAPVTTENKPLEVGNIPLHALNFLSQPSALNDEITVIKSTEKKKKHGKKAEEESTRVIVIGKKFDTKPDIQYQVPVRF